MKFTDIFIQRPVLAIVVSCLLLLLGLQASQKLPLRQFPEVENSVIGVETYYPGASASTVQGFVTVPLQRRLASASGVDYITSESKPGHSWIEVHVRLGENTSAVIAELIAKINQARFELPDEIEDPVIRTNTGGNALMYLAFRSDKMSVEQLSDYLLRVVQPEISTLPGVGAADILGPQYYALRAWLDPARMAGLGVTAEDIRNALQRNHYISAAGNVRGNLVQATVDVRTDIRKPEEFGAIVVRQQGDRRVLLEEVADLELASMDSESASFSNGKRALFISVRPAPGANPLAVANGVKALLPQLVERMPSGMSGHIDFDASTYISEALSEVITSLLEAAAIVVLVIYLFLGSLRVVLIPLVAIPLSLVGVLFLVYLLGFSLNLLTLLALVIAIGLVVDDAIVVVENVHRHIEEGDAPLQASLKGARQVAWPVIAMTLTLAAVYAPIGLLGGMTGILFSEFALTLAGAVFVSGIVALTLSPVMCAKVLSDQSHQGRFATWLDARFHQLRDRYRSALAITLEHRNSVVLFSIVIIGSLPLLLGQAQQELAPEEDTGAIYMVSIPPQYASLDYINRFTEEIATLWKGIPEVADAFQVNSTRNVFGGVILTPWQQRDRSQQEVQQELQAGLSRISGLQIFSFSDAALPGGDEGPPVDFIIATTAGYEALDEVSEQVLAAARQSGKFVFINKNLDFTRPEVSVNIDRDQAARLGISMQSIANTLAIMLGGQEVNRFSLDGRSYEVIPQAARNFRLNEDWLERYYIRTGEGELVPLSTIINVNRQVEPNVLRQYQQLNSVTISGVLAPGVSLGTALELLEDEANAVLPTGYRIGHGGESRRYLAEQDNFAALFAFSLLLIYLILAAQFNSLRDPMVVLIAVPMSIFGAAIPLAAGIVTLNIYTQVGLVTLIGLISKHGILIIDFANQLAREGMSRKEAVLDAAALRLRPVLMTTFATVLGVLPLLTAFGAGANSRFSIGLMISCGMLVGTLFTLFVVPAFYLPFFKTSPELAITAAPPAPPV